MALIPTELHLFLPADLIEAASVYKAALEANLYLNLTDAEKAEEPETRQHMANIAGLYQTAYFEVMESLENLEIRLTEMREPKELIIGVASDHVSN